MKGMKKESIESREHAWNVSTQEARAIQEKLRARWQGEDRLGTLRTVAGLDASFILSGSQAMAAKVRRWVRLRAANRAIGCVVLFRFPEMGKIAREFAQWRWSLPTFPDC